jgi:transposase-like protein
MSNPAPENRTGHDGPNSNPWEPSPTPFPTERDLLLAWARQTRWPSGQPVRCLHCRSERVRRWGIRAGRQRYRCQACEKTFNDLTGTPLARLRQLPKLGSYVSAMAAGATLREAASQSGISLGTSFSWRHRLLHAMDPIVSTGAPLRKAGLTARRARWIYLPGGLALGSGRRREHLWVFTLAGVSRGTSRSSLILTAGEPTRTVPNPQQLLKTLDPHLAFRAQLTIQGPIRQPMVWASRHKEWRVNHGNAESSLAVALTVSEGISAWFCRFRGVSARYANNYLCWRLIESERFPEIPSEARWPLPPRVRPYTNPLLRILALLLSGPEIPKE